MEVISISPSGLVESEASKGGLGLVVSVVGGSTDLLVCFALV